MPSGRSAVPSAAQQQKEQDGPPAASGAATGGLAGPCAQRPGSRSYLSSPTPPVPLGTTEPGACCFAAVCAAGPAHVSAGGAGAESASSGRTGGAAPTRAPCPLAAILARFGLRLPLRAAAAPPTLSAGPVSPGADQGGRADLGRAEPRRGAAVGCLVSASSPERGLFSWPRRDLLLLLTSLHSTSCTLPLDGGSWPPPRDASVPVRGPALLTPPPTLLTQGRGR